MVAFSCVCTTSGSVEGQNVRAEESLEIMEPSAGDLGLTGGVGGGREQHNQNSASLFWFCATPTSTFALNPSLTLKSILGWK